MRVLVVDDDPATRTLVRRVLEREGCDVVEAGDGRAALAAISDPDLALVVLDANLPDTSGFDLLPELRHHAPDLYVLMLTAAGSEDDRVRGLTTGADDYVVKPFSPRELGARVNAVRRRLAASGSTVIDAGELRIDIAARAVTKRGVALDLRRKEFDLLCHLVTHAGRAFSRGELLRAVWGSSAEWQTPATVTEHIRRLRGHIEPDPTRPRHIVTVHGVGYRFERHPH